MKKMLATLVAATVLGAGGLAVASATDSSTGSTATTTSKPADAGRRGTVGLSMRRLAFATAAKTIGISPTDLRKGMRGGHSIADVAKAHDVAEQTVIDAIVKAVDARIQHAATNGRITSTQATKLEQAVATRVPKLVEATPKQLRRHRTVSAAIDVAAKTIGVTPRALRQAIASRQSVAAVATAHDIDAKTVVAALVTAGEARIDKAVTQHHIDAARAAKLKARLPLRAQGFVDFTRGAAKAANAAATAA